ncbi:NAD(P)/FAD-dependent oxidoreductase [Jiulongibacter sp. NS-SX5]|uniref:NAD(P)/FAD-dependent oxidoreductase n=1 Tax=Jiulongibacter sp. NS-SX5 TaxID=3463854 RepID=UPI0040590CCF
MIDYLIVGQGIAGTTLAFQLLKKGVTVRLIDNPKLPSSSKVAGGMFNPVTGKHLAKTWLADTLYPYLFEFYPEIEKLTGGQFFHPIPIYRPFKNEHQKAQFEKLIPKHDIEHFCQIIAPQKELEGKINNPLGGVLTSQCGRLDVEQYLDSSRQYFDKLRIINSGQFEYDSMHIEENKISYQNIEYKQVVFCEGYHAVQNPYFNSLPFNAVKGETLDIKLNTELPQQIINQGKWLMPVNKGLYKAGATYSWHELDAIPTEKGREQVIEGIEKFYLKGYGIKNHKAGVRPATKDRRPFSGRHPQYKNLIIFNGLGTKGVSLAPYLAQNLADHLTEGKEIDQETTIDRLNALY